MTYNPDIHHRRSIRLKDYDYSQAGAYFVTLCVWQRECLFGESVNGEMVLNDVGQVVDSVWNNLPGHYVNIKLDSACIMPNHFHGIINIVDAADMVGAGLKPALTGSACAVRHHGLAEIIRGFKTFSAKHINTLRNNPGCPVWQRNYYERIIRGDDELSRAREYIVNNPMKWELDKENPKNCGQCP
jgi:putative transposase